MSLYPRTQNNAQLAATVVKLLDAAIGTVEEGQGWAATFTNEQTGQMAGTPAAGGMTATYQQRENQPIAEDYLEEKRTR
jgi:hypothetical protein